MKIKKILALLIIQTLLVSSFFVTGEAAEWNKITTDALMETSIYTKDSHTYESEGLRGNLVLKKNKNVIYYKVFPIQKNIDQYNKLHKNDGAALEEIGYGYSNIIVQKLVNGTYKTVKHPLKYLDIKILRNGKYEELPDLYERPVSGDGECWICTWKEAQQLFLTEPICLKITLKDVSSENIQVIMSTHCRMKFSGVNGYKTISTQGDFCYYVSEQNLKTAADSVRITGGKGKITFGNFSKVLEVGQLLCIEASLYKDKKCSKCVVGPHLMNTEVQWKGISKGTYYVKFRAKAVTSYGGNENAVCSNWIVKKVVVK